MRALLYRLTNHLPCRLIAGDGGERYLERYFLFALGPRGNPWIAAYVHRFVASDPARGYHDHPWRWAMSMILSGRYLEQTVGDDFTATQTSALKTPGRISTFGPNHKHRVDLLGTECWTLFMHGRWIRPWGFYRYVFGRQANGRAAIAWFYEQYSSECTAGWWRIAKTGKELRRLAAERKSRGA